MSAATLGPQWDEVVAIRTTDGCTCGSVLTMIGPACRVLFLLFDEALGLPCSVSSARKRLIKISFIFCALSAVVLLAWNRADASWHGGVR